MSLLRQAELCFVNQKTYKALNAFISLPKDHTQAYQEAQRADERQKNGVAKSPLDGQIIAIKDNICTTDQPTTCASKILNNFVSPNAATVVEKLKAVGAIIAGKTNLDEFGMGSHSTNSHYGSVKSHLGQRNEPLSAGGSSGGSAIAVATGQCLAALGTDTGGSVRLPAAYTGIVGFKPSYGMVSRWGVVAYANSLDTVGVLASSCKTAKSIYDIIKGYDSHDPTSMSISTLSRLADQLKNHKSRRVLQIGVPVEYNTAELDPIVRQTWSNILVRLQEQGHTIQSISLPSTQSALSAYYVLAPAEASSNLAKYDGVRFGNKPSSRDKIDGILYAATRGDGLGDEVKRRILLGSYSLSAAAMDNYFIQAQKVRRLVQQDFDHVFTLAHPLRQEEEEEAEKTMARSPRRGPGVDLIISPTAQSLPPTLSAVAASSALVNAYGDDILTVPASLAGLPAISVPVRIGAAEIRDDDDGDDEAKPRTVGIQIIAQYGQDDLVLEAGCMLEQIQV